MSTTHTSEWEFPEELMPAGYNISEQQWQEHVNEIIGIGQGEINMAWSVVFARVDKELSDKASDPTKGIVLHVSEPGKYAPIPETSSAQSGAIETVFPALDEEEIQRWKLIPCSARLQFANTWVCFQCKLLESEGYPEKFTIATKSTNVIDCKVYRMANDDNGNRLLWVNLKAWKDNTEKKVELCCKKVVGGEVPKLTEAEEEYVFDEDYGRFFEEPYVGV